MISAMKSLIERQKNDEIKALYCMDLVSFIWVNNSKNVPFFL